MQQLVIPARSTAPQNDLLFENLVRYIEACCGGLLDCKRCSVEATCLPWFNGVCDLSGTKHPLTNHEFWRAVSRFEEIRRRR